MKTQKYLPAIILGLSIYSGVSSNLLAEEVSSDQQAQVASSNTNPLGIGDMSYSNQNDYEKFKHSFYFFWSPLNLANNQLSSYSGNYQSNFANTHLNGFGIGVRHNLLELRHNLGILGDYNLSTFWKKGTVSSNDNIQLSNSSNEINLLAFDIGVKGLLSYTYRDVFVPFTGIAVNFISSRVQSTLGGGDNSFSEIHYGPDIGFQALNFPLQNSFFSFEWIQYLKQKESNSRVFSDGSKEQVSVGINF